ncbi:hypothetical protein Tco_1137536 [Tanacetum coccineum]
MPRDLPLLRVNTLGSDEGSRTLQELMVFYTKFSKKVESLETDLKQTKLTYGATYTKLIKKDPSKQGRKIAKIHQDPAISLVQHDAEIQERHEHDMEFDFDLDDAKDVSTTEKDVSTTKPVFTTGAAVTIASVADVSTAKDKGKGKMDESEPVQTKTKLQQEQERLGYEAAVRLQAELKEEEKERIARRLQAEEREMYTKAEQARMLELRGYSFDEIKTLFEKTMRRVNKFVPIESEVDIAVPELAARSSKGDAEDELDQERSKRQKTGESSELAEELKDKE